MFVVVPGRASLGALAPPLPDMTLPLAEGKHGGVGCGGVGWGGVGWGEGVDGQVPIKVLRLVGFA